MEKQTKTQEQIKEILETLDGQEISSMHYEDVVAVVGNKVMRAGKVIDTINTLPKAKRLMGEAFENEFGYSCGSEAHKKALQEEFGGQETIQTVEGTAYFVKTEVEDDDGKWNDNYNVKDGFYVTHYCGIHHIYKVKGEVSA